MTNHSLGLLYASLSGAALVYLDAERRRLSLVRLHKTSLLVLADVLSPAIALAYGVFVWAQAARWKPTHNARWKFS